MSTLLTDLLAVFGVVLNALPQGLLALSFGFAAVPTAMAFFIGALGNVITGNLFSGRNHNLCGNQRKRSF